MSGGGDLPDTDGGSTRKIVPDAWDFKGRPAVRSETGGWSSAALALGLHKILSSFNYNHFISYHFWQLVYG